jgi:hypothetical protein
VSPTTLDHSSDFSIFQSYLFQIEPTPTTQGSVETSKTDTLDTKAETPHPPPTDVPSTNQDKPHVNEPIQPSVSGEKDTGKEQPKVRVPSRHFHCIRYFNAFYIVLEVTMYGIS